MVFSGHEVPGTGSIETVALSSLGADVGAMDLAIEAHEPLWVPKSGTFKAHRTLDAREPKDPTARPVTREKRYGSLQNIHSLDVKSTPKNHEM